MGELASELGELLPEQTTTRFLRVTTYMLCCVAATMYVFKVGTALLLPCTSNEFPPCSTVKHVALRRGALNRHMATQTHQLAAIGSTRHLPSYIDTRVSYKKHLRWRCMTRWCTCACVATTLLSQTSSSVATQVLCTVSRLDILLEINALNP